MATAKESQTVEQSAENTVAKASTKKASTKKASTKKASTKKASTKKASTKKASTKKASTKKASTKKASTKKASTKKAVRAKGIERGGRSFTPSDRKLVMVPIPVLQTNPGNPGRYREQEAIEVLYDQGYRIFPGEDNDGNVVAPEFCLWTMLNGTEGQDPDINLRQQAVHLIEEFEPEIVSFADSIAEHGIIKPITVVVTEGNQFGIETGMIRAFAKSFNEARNEMPPGLIPAEIVNGDDLSRLYARASVENLHTIANKPMMLAFRYHTMNQAGMSINEIAKAVSCSAQTIRNYLDFIHAPADIQDGLQAGTISRSDARDMIQTARETGEDIEEVADRESPTRDESRKPPKKHRQLVLNAAKVWAMLWDEYKREFDKDELQKCTKAQLIERVILEHRHSVDLLRDVMKLTEQELQDRIKEQEESEKYDFDLSDFDPNA